MKIGKWKYTSLFLAGMFLVPIALGMTDSIYAQEGDIVEEEVVAEEAVAEENGVSDEMFTVNNVWMMVATFLVFAMHLGFSMLEAGLTRAKNTLNILFKNVSIICIGILTYALMGFNIMYPGDFNGFLGFAGFGLDPGADGQTSAYDPGFTYYTDYLFQAMFAATAATIVSGAVAERIKLSAFIVFSVIYVAIAYPIIGSWQWGGGWLDQGGFYDFAGSTLVHSVGGWAALAGVIVIGPRLGKYLPDGTIRPIFGHNMPLATIGMFLLWLGWFGFNGGSVLSADANEVSFVLTTTSLAASAGVFGAIVTTLLITKKPDLSMALNGALAGLVAITAGADVISVMNAVIVGFIGGIIVVFSVLGLDRMKLDDPVGAISVHLTVGIWGTLAVGIFGGGDFVWQLIGVVSAGVFAFLFALILFLILKFTIGVRVDREEELKGLDIGEHGVEAYSGFQIYTLE